MTDDYSSLAQDVEKKFLDWFGDPVPADLPHTADANHRTHRTRKKHTDVPTKLLLLMLFFGFIGAFSFVVGAYILFYYLNYEGLYSYIWPGQSIVYIFATLFGFGFGLFIFFIMVQEKK